MNRRHSMVRSYLHQVLCDGDGRLGATDDVVAVVLHLASDASSNSTGAEFTMDGGTGL